MARDKGSIFLDAGFDCNFSARIAKGLEGFLRAQIQAHRLLCQSREGNKNRFAFNSAFRSVAATDIGHHHPHATLRYAEHARDLLAQWKRSLAAAPDGNLVASKISHRNVRLQRIVLSAGQEISLFKNGITFFER